MQQSNQEKVVSTLVERVDGLRRETEYRYAALRTDMDARHDENKELLRQIFEQTKLTNGSVAELKFWRKTHEDVTEERAKAIDKRFAEIHDKVEVGFAEINNKTETAQIALNLLKDERLVKTGEMRMLKLLWVPISALVGALASHLFPVIEKLLKLP